MQITYLLKKRDGVMLSIACPHHQSPLASLAIDWWNSFFKMNYAKFFRNESCCTF